MELCMIYDLFMAMFKGSFDFIKTISGQSYCVMCQRMISFEFEYYIIIMI